MSSLLDKVKSALTPGLSHEVPKITHRQKILLAISAAHPKMPDHQTGFFWGELLHPWETLTAQGWDCDIVSETGSAQPDEDSLGKMAASGDKAKWDDKDFPIHHKLAAMRAAAQVNPAEYRAMYFAGGHACCEDFPTARQLKKLAAQIYESGGVIGADCHGPAIFQDLTLSNGQNILQGKQATGFSVKGEEASGAKEWLDKNNYRTMQDIVQMSGGKWTEHESNPMAEYVIVSDRIVTGMNPASAKGVAEAMLKFMKPEQEIEPLAPGSTLASVQTDKSAVARDEANDRLKERNTYEGEKRVQI